MILHKAYEIASFKALEDEGPGRFEAVVSVFGNVDLQGDRTMPGAFKRTIAAWRKKGDPVPVVWSHDWLNPDAHIGWADPGDIMEINVPVGKEGEAGGLLVKGWMDVHKPFAGQVFDLLKSRRVKEWSFAYDTVKEKRAEDGANELFDLDLLEVGPTLKGANPSTYTISAKSALEDELKQAYEDSKQWTRFIDFAKTVDDPEISRMLTKTFVNGTSDKVEVDKPVSSMTDEEIYAALGVTTSKSFGTDTNTNGGSTSVTVQVSPKIVTENAGLKTALAAWGKATGHEVNLESVLDGVALADVDGMEFEFEFEEKSDGTVEIENPVLVETDEKAQGKPWHVEKRGDQYCVIKDSDGSTVACHDTEEMAMAQVRALYANESDDEADGEKAILPDVANVRQHLISEHEAQAAEVEGIDEEDLNEEHRTIHGRSSATGHNHDEADEGKSVEEAAKLFVAAALGQKVGRVISAKSAAGLKSALSGAVDEFVAEVNGAAMAADEEKTVEEPTMDPDAELKARLDALLGDN